MTRDDLRSFMRAGRRFVEAGQEVADVGRRAVHAYRECDAAATEAGAELKAAVEGDDPLLVAVPDAAGRALRTFGLKAGRALMDFASGGDKRESS